MKPAPHLRGSLSSISHQAENYSARGGAGPARRPAEPERSQSGLSTSRPARPGRQRGVHFPRPTPSTQTDTNALGAGAVVDTSGAFVNPPCSRDCKTKLRFSNKPGREGDQWEQSQAEMAWASGQLTSRGFQRVVVPGSDCVP